MGLGHSPRIVTNGLIMCLDGANKKSYTGSGSNAFDVVNGFNFQIVNLGTTMNFDNATKSFRSTRTAGTRNGGYMTCSTSGVLNAVTYLNGNHTTEVWARINDFANTNIDATETQSALFVYPGYHSMYYYNPTSLTYNMWNGTSNSVRAFIAPVTSYITQGQWFHVATTRQSNTLTMYINGVSVANATGTMVVTSDVTNNIRIGTANIATNYFWAADCNVACAKMYNRNLSDSEIMQNFNALRGRFGL